MRTLAELLAVVALTFAALLRVSSTSKRTLFLMLPNYFGTAWSHYLAAAGAIAALLGFITGGAFAAAAGIAASLLAGDYVRRVTASRDAAFQQGLGETWRTRISPTDEARMLKRRWSWRVPRSPQGRFTQDLPFATLPGGRRLLCDVWEPPPEVPRSSTAILYLHGSAWCLLDKDVGTRAFLRHLAAQGHVVMDVAYRLCPETDGVGMVADAKRAIVWMKEHAKDYGVNPARVVLMGGSAGAHVALLAAYSAGKPELTPKELSGRDTRVLAVVSYYGVTDLLAHDAWQHQLDPPEGPPMGPPRAPPTRRARAIWRALFGRELPPEVLPPPLPRGQLMHALAGGLSTEVPARFELLSPIHHVSSECPPTLHFQAQYDVIVPVASARALHVALRAAGVPAVYVELPYTLHAFDLMIPALFSPASQSALYDVERFLAWAGAVAPAELEHGHTSQDVLVPA